MTSDEESHGVFACSDPTSYITLHLHSLGLTYKSKSYGNLEHFTGCVEPEELSMLIMPDSGPICALADDICLCWHLACQVCMCLLWMHASVLHDEFAKRLLPPYNLAQRASSHHNLDHFQSVKPLQASQASEQSQPCLPKHIICAQASRYSFFISTNPIFLSRYSLCFAPRKLYFHQNVFD